MNEDGVILVTMAEPSARRNSPRELKIEVLSENVSIFMGQVESILEKTPKSVGRYQLDEITVSAEISAKGQLVLLGTGGELGATGGLTFKFKRTPVTNG